MELKSGKSTKHIVKALKGVTDARILNKLTKEEVILRSEINEDTKNLLSHLTAGKAPSITSNDDLSQE